MLESLRVHARLCGVQFDHNAEIVGFEDSRNRPGAILASREIRRADIIIVCNGVNSTAKSLLFSDDQLPQLRRPSNFSVYQAIMDSENVTRDPQCSCEYGPTTRRLVLTSLTLSSVVDLLE